MSLYLKKLAGKASLYMHQLDNENWKWLYMKLTSGNMPVINGVVGVISYSCNKAVKHFVHSNLILWGQNERGKGYRKNDGKRIFIT